MMLRNIVQRSVFKLFKFKLPTPVAILGAEIGGIGISRVFRRYGKMATIARQARTIGKIVHEST